MTLRERERLRALARRQAELAHSDRNICLRAEWEQHGDLRAATRPMLRVELWTFADDILPPLMQCESPDARAIENTLLSNIVNFDLFGDDTLVPDGLAVSPHAWFIPFGIPVRRQETGGLGHRFTPVLQDLGQDFHKLGPSQFGVHTEAAHRELDTLRDLLGDILPVEPARFSLTATPTQDIVHIMSMEDMFLAMYDTPELFHRMMDMLTADYEAYFAMLAQNGHLQSAAHDQHLCQGSYCYTNELRETSAPAALKDMWLYMDSQETSSISPDMYAEFVFPYYERLMRLVGLVSYGCCEPVHGIWSNCLSRISNLRKVSISPWCDEAMMGEALRDRRAVYLRKPSPNLLGLGTALDEDAVRAHFARTAICASGCKLELAQRDVYHVRSAETVRRYVQLAREALEAYRP